MEMTDELKDSILSATAPIIGSLTAGLLVGLAAKAIESLLVTNYSSNDPTGDKGVHPTDSGTAISKADVAGTEAEGKLAQDKVAGANGEVKASETEARAATGEATAAESGASALRTKAGASDIETKALKMT